MEFIEKVKQAREEKLLRAEKYAQSIQQFKSAFYELEQRNASDKELKALLE